MEHDDGSHVALYEDSKYTVMPGVPETESVDEQDSADNTRQADAHEQDHQANEEVNEGLDPRSQYPRMLAEHDDE